MSEYLLTGLLVTTLMIGRAADGATAVGPFASPRFMNEVRAAMLSAYFYADGLDKAAPPVPWKPIKLVEAGKILSKDRSTNSNSRRRRFAVMIGAAAVHEPDPRRRSLLINGLRALRAPAQVIALATGKPPPGLVTVQMTELQIQRILDHPPPPPPGPPGPPVDLYARACCSCMTECSVSTTQKATDLARVDFVLDVERTSDEVAAATDPRAWAACNADYFKEAFYAGANLGAVSSPPQSVPSPAAAQGGAWDGIVFEHVETDVQNADFMVKNLLQIDTSVFAPGEALRYRLDYGLAKALAMQVLGQAISSGGLVEDCGYAVVTDTGSTPPQMTLRGTKQIRFPELGADIGLEYWLPLALRVVADDIAAGVCCGASGFTGSCDCAESCDEAPIQDVLNNDTRLCK